MSDYVPVYRPYLNGNEKKYTNECIDSSWISSKGEFVEKFENSFSRYIACQYATSVSNGTVALHVALEALGLSDGDEIIVPSLTYVASVNTIVQTKAVPIFVDSREDTLQMDCDDVVSKITSRTKAILAVHLYGHPCEMDRILKICKEHDLFLIEDCAEGFGSYFKGQHVGTFGDVATFSFFGNKTITTGEGGMVVTPHERLYNRIKLLKSQGASLEKRYWHDVLGYNYRMTNIEAAIGLAQLEQADSILRRKKRIASCYEKSFKGLPLSFHTSSNPEVIHSYWMCSIILDDRSLTVDLRKSLSESGVETRPFFYPAHTLPMYSKRYYNLPVAESLSERGINLPSWPGLNDPQIGRICSAVCHFFEK